MVLATACMATSSSASCTATVLMSAAATRATASKLLGLVFDTHYLPHFEKQFVDFAAVESKNTFWKRFFYASVAFARWMEP
jgi:hypothetical protein